MSSTQRFDSVSDQALLGQFTALVKQDQRVTADLLRYLDAIDRRQLWAKFGYSSLFVFCQKRFNMSEAVAGKRIGAMRTVLRFPVLLSMVERGELHLSGIQLGISSGVAWIYAGSSVPIVKLTRGLRDLADFGPTTSAFGHRAAVAGACR